MNNKNILSLHRDSFFKLLNEACAEKKDCSPAVYLFQPLLLHDRFMLLPLFMLPYNSRHRNTIKDDIR